MVVRNCYLPALPFDMLQRQAFDTEGREILVIDTAYFRTGRFYGVWSVERPKDHFLTIRMKWPCNIAK